MSYDAFYEVLLVAGAVACAIRPLRVARERLAWSLVAVALLLWALADLYSLVVEPTAYPSIADAGWLLFYPLCYAAIWMLVRSRLQIASNALWIDGILGGLTVAALAAALVFQPIADASSGSTAEVLTNFAYPIGDLGLLVLVVAAVGVTGWRPDRTLLLLGSGLAVAAVADTLYLYLVATDRYDGVAGSVDALWPISMLLIAAAAWQPPPRPRRVVRVTGWRALVLPSVFMTIALALQLRDHFDRLPSLSVMLATAALLIGIARMALAFRDNDRMLTRTRRDAMTDALTGLRNRRALIEDLEEQVDLARDSKRRVLALFDLDGFKSYNDSFGHAAGDELLARLGRRLAAAVEGKGCAYRLGGDEFCVLAQIDDESGPGPLLAHAAGALRDVGEGFAVASSYGSVSIPEDASTANAALLLADRRMYAAKHGGRDPAGRQTRDVLVTTLRESEPELAEHVDGVARYALAVARELGMPHEECLEVARAAELHDIGKIAIPDAILGKAGTLDDAEWDFMRRHTVIGERILASAPAMRMVAKLVRSSHERWDGKGYPDALSGEAIPLGARIVSVCDAYEAMVSDRPYRAGMSPADALAELERCAGTQFDPRVVAAFAALPDWEREAAPQARVKRLPSVGESASSSAT